MALGFKPSALEWELQKIQLPISFHMHTTKEESHGISGIRVEMHMGKTHGHSCADMELSSEPLLLDFATCQNVLENEDASDTVKNNTIRVFNRLAAAQANVEKKPIKDLRFPPVVLVNMVGVVIGLEKLGIKKILCSSISNGVQSDSKAPLITPLVGEILQDIQVVPASTSLDLITPTGAALVAELADSFEPLPNWPNAKTGYGFGPHKFADRPQVLCALLNE